MLAFFEHFSEAKAFSEHYSSILVVFSRKINFFQETKKEIIIIIIIIRENED